jgi:photosystem II stability/assembly factor-like uncharacterized protein
MRITDIVQAQIKYYKTTNGGTTWNLLNTTPGNLFANVVKTFSAGTVYIGSDKELFISTDGGATWTEKSVGSGDMRGMDWSDQNNGTVVGVEGYTAKTTNAGDTWTI